MIHLVLSPEKLAFKYLHKKPPKVCHPLKLLTLVS